MKSTMITAQILLALLLGARALADTPQTLTLQDLVNRPDRWPATVTIQQDLHLRNGAVVHQGDAARVVRFDGARVFLIAPGNLPFVISPQDSGLLDAANQAWAALTPAQRAIAPDTLPDDRSLWPLRVTTNQAITCNLGKLPPGTELSVVMINKNGTDIAWPNSPNRLILDFSTTDAIARARQLALVEPDKRDSRMAATLQNLMVDADGKPYHDDHLGDKKYFLLYFGASWCPPCRAFSPDLVKYLAATMPKHPELAAVMMSNDEQPDQMLGYMKEEKMPFPAVPLKQLNQSPFLLGFAGQKIPELVVVDRFGKVLADSEDRHGNLSDPKDTLGALDKLLMAQIGQ